MKNKNYPLYQLPYIADLKEMLQQKSEFKSTQVAFSYINKNRNIIEKTYREFQNEVNALGTWMYHQGLQGKHIAIISENSYEWLLCFFAIVNGGSVAVPIDKELPSDEIEKLLEKADVEAIFYSKRCANVIETVTEKMNVCNFSMEEMEIYIASGSTCFQQGEHAFVEYHIERNCMCCIMFTSGTSGACKGVMLSQKNIVEDINGSCELFQLEGNTVALLPFHHAFGLVVGVLMVFNYGYTVHINKSLKRVQKDLQREKPQTLFLVPLFVETFHKQIWVEAKKGQKEKLLHVMMRISNLLLRVGIDIRERNFTLVCSAFGGNLKYIICGGAPLDKQYIEEFRSLGIEILNGYGTTECAPCAAVNRNKYHRDGSVGQPIPNTEIQIAEDGEVLVKGPLVMLGYYKDEEETRDVLKDGWYATGDLGLLDDDGFLILTGRKKNLIILSNGENISPEELEMDFRQDKGVQEVLVYEKNGIIVAEIYPDSELFLEMGQDKVLQQYFEELRKKVNQKRPIYKQVDSIIIRDTEFPKNTNRKILRYKIN